MGEIQTVEDIEKEKEFEQFQEDELNRGNPDDDAKIVSLSKEVEKSHMKVGICKECKRKEKLYRDLCYWCYVEALRDIYEEFSREIRAEGRSNLISTDKMKIIRDKLLEMI